MSLREYRALVHEEDGSYWAEVDGLPGCFASVHDLDELREAIVEAIMLYLEGQHPAGSSPRASAQRQGDARARVRVTDSPLQRVSA